LAREERILQLRILGWNYHRIAKELGISHSPAHARCKAAVARLHESVVHHANQLRMLQLVRYEAMLACLWEQATTGGPRDSCTPWNSSRGSWNASTEWVEQKPRCEGSFRVVDEVTLVEATKKIEQQADDMEAVIARRERMKTDAIEASVVGSPLVMDAVAR
jgi:hypothetical protein